MSTIAQTTDKLRTLAELAREQGWKLKSVAFKAIGGTAEAKVLFTDKNGQNIPFQI